MKGALWPTANIWTVSEARMRDIVKWKGKVIGIAESFFPHPKEWRFEGVDTALDEVTVRSFCRMLCDKTRVDPACWSAWEKRIGELPRDIGERYNTKLLTPRDWASHFKNVLHRALMTRSRGSGEPCRCCGHARENLLHLATCETAGEIFKRLHSISEGEPWGNQREQERFALFALLPKSRLANIWTDLHLLIWKHLIALMVRIEFEGAKFDESQVWAPAWKRLEKKVLALRERVGQEIRRAESRGDPPPDVSRRSKAVAPLARFASDGKFEWNDDLVAKIKALGKPKKVSAVRRQ